MGFVLKYWYLFAALIAFVLIFIIEKMKKTVVASTSVSAKYATVNEDKNANLGQKNNNPLNIRLTKETWKGKIKSNNAFEAFDTIEHGYRAALISLHTYYSAYRIRTIHGMVSRWAPSSENDTKGYIANVSKETGIGADQEIVFNRTTMNPIISAMSHQETGMRPTKQQLETAWLTSGLV